MQYFETVPLLWALVGALHPVGVNSTERVGTRVLASPIPFRGCLKHFALGSQARRLRSRLVTAGSPMPRLSQLVGSFDCNARAFGATVPTETPSGPKNKLTIHLQS